MKKTIFLLIVIGLLNFNLFAQGSETKSGKSIKHARILVMEEWDEETMKPRFSAILGGIENGKYVPSKTAVKFTETGSFSLFSLLGAEEGEVNITKTETPMEEICEEYYSVETDETASSGIMISSDTPWNAMPRVPQALSNKDATYLSLVKTFLIGKGIKTPKVKIDQIYKIDLEGDGEDEVVISATNYNGQDADSRAGDYSFVYVRKITGMKDLGKPLTRKINGKIVQVGVASGKAPIVENILIAGEFYPTAKKFNAPSKYKLTSIVDLNGDGKMEVIIYGAYYEGSWVEAHSISGNKSVKVLETGCGV